MKLSGAVGSLRGSEIKSTETNSAQIKYTQTNVRQYGNYGNYGNYFRPNHPSNHSHPKPEASYVLPWQSNQGLMSTGLLALGLYHYGKKFLKHQANLQKLNGAQENKPKHLDVMRKNIQQPKTI